MGSIKDADDDRAGDASLQSEPERSQYDRYIVEALEYVVEHVEGERGKIMGKADPDDKGREEGKAENIRIFHFLLHVAAMPHFRLQAGQAYAELRKD